MVHGLETMKRMNEEATKKPSSNRKELLTHLLRPITCDWSSSIQYRKDLVHKRRQEVLTVMSFLTKEEKKLAQEWLDKEHHSELWD